MKKVIKYKKYNEISDTYYDMILTFILPELMILCDFGFEYKIKMIIEVGSYETYEKEIHIITETEYKMIIKKINSDTL